MMLSTLLAVSSASAKISLNPLFQKGAVLQREMSVPVWGNASPGALVEVSCAGKSAFARASSVGSFIARLPELPAGGPYKLTVIDHDNSEKISVDDILVGEVFLASGQSNMEYMLNADWRNNISPDGGESLARKQEREFFQQKDALKDFRVFIVKRSYGPALEYEADGKWTAMDSPEAGKASAAAAWFGMQLRKKLNVPVGIVVSAYGGTLVEAWTSRAGLTAYGSDPLMLNDMDKFRQQEAIWRDRNYNDDYLRSNWSIADSGNEGILHGWAKPEYNDSFWKEMELPGSWITNGIAGNGAVWFRKKVEIPRDLAGKDLRLEIPGIDKQDVTYFNGVEVGRTGSRLDISFWNTLRSYVIPGKLVKEGVNTIAIRAYSFSSNGGFFGAANKHILTATDGSWQSNIAGKWKVHVEVDHGVLPSEPPFYPFNPASVNTPESVFNHMVNPLIPFAVRGIIWYQGESNAWSNAAARSYRQNLAAMIKDWRYRWEKPSLPFIQVQLAGFDSVNETWADLRESQRLICKDMDNVYMVSAIDIGESKDIHPQNKKDVGMRLASSALHYIFSHTDEIPSGPLFASCWYHNGALRIKFDHAEGLEFRGNTPEKSFEIAGVDGKFVPADTVKLISGEVEVSAKSVPMPHFVRYAWSNDPASVLFNKAGYPASSFDSRNK